jgi:hypothetical protein
MKNSYDRYEFLWHAYDMNLCHMMLVYVNSYDIMKSYIKWCWCPFSSDWNHHVKLLATMLCWLRKKSFTICPFTMPSERLTGLDNGLRHNVYTLEKENIDAILHMDWPCNATELCMFIGYVSYYHTCRRVAHISLNLIYPQFDNLLHGQTKCRKHLYNAYAYGCKSIACPNHNKWFRIHTNSSDFQLGRCIIQERRLIAYFSCNWQCHSKIILHWNSKYFPS